MDKMLKSSGWRKKKSQPSGVEDAAGSVDSVDVEKTSLTRDLLLRILLSSSEDVCVCVCVCE